MAKIYFHVDVNSAFLSWSALKALQDGGTVDLRTIPAVVGGDETKRHGVVLAKSGPAKQYGIKTGESLFAARTKCPGLTVVPPDFDWYVQNSKALIQILNGEMPIGMQGTFNLVDVRDLAAGTIAAADRGRKGECYILSNDEVSLKELCEMLKAETGCRGCLFYLPLSLAHFAAKQMEARAAKTGKPAVLTEFAVYNLERNNHFDCSKAKNELGFAPRPYKETLHDLAVWLKQEGKIA